MLSGQPAVMKKQVFLLGTSVTQRLSSPVSQWNSIGLKLPNLGPKPGVKRVP